MNSTLRTAGNISRVLVAKCAAASGLAEGASVSGGLADGIVAVVKPDNTVIDIDQTILSDDAGYIAGGGLFRIVQGTGVGNPLRMGPLMKSGEYTLTGHKYIAATEQITYIGYDPVNSGTAYIDAANASTSYHITVIMQNPNEADRSQSRRVYGQYTTPASGASDSISTAALTNNLIKNFAKLKDDNVLIERVCTGTATALGTGVDNIVFTNGSSTISATDIDDATTNAALAVGQAIRVGTAATDPVYIITAIDATANTATLDVPYQGTTQTLADTAVRRIATPGEWGIRLTGIARTFDVAKNRNNYKTRFVVKLSDSFNSTGVTTTQNAFEGIGTPNQVAMDYYEGSGFNGQNDLIGVPPGSRDAVPTAITGEYATLNFAISNNVTSVVSNSVLKSELIVYLEYSDGSTGGTDGDVSANGEDIVGTTATYDA